MNLKLNYNVLLMTKYKKYVMICILRYIYLVILSQLDYLINTIYCDLIELK